MSDNPQTTISDADLTRLETMLKAVHCSRVIYMGRIEPPAVVQEWGIRPFYDAEFYFSDFGSPGEPFTPREFVPGSPFRVALDEIVQFMIDAGIEEGVEFTPD